MVEDHGGSGPSKGLARQQDDVVRRYGIAPVLFDSSGVIAPSRGIMLAAATGPGEIQVQVRDRSQTVI